MDTLLESVRMMASFKDSTIELGRYLRESIGVNNSTFAVELSELIFFREGSRTFMCFVFGVLFESSVYINDFGFIVSLMGGGKTSTLSLNVSSETLETSSALTESVFIAKIKNSAVSFIKRNILQHPKNELDIHRL